jgi:hypothetical protein
MDHLKKTTEYEAKKNESLQSQRRKAYLDLVEEAQNKEL